MSPEAVLYAFGKATDPPDKLDTEACVRPEAPRLVLMSIGECFGPGAPNKRDRFIATMGLHDPHLVTSGGDMDSIEQRERAHEAWEFALGHLVNKGCEEAIALETMAKVAFRSYAERQGSTAASSYFRHLSEQAESDERGLAASMMWA